MLKKGENKLNSKISTSYCQACLSSDRNLSAVGEYLDIYTNIMNMKCKVSQAIRLCWECMAVLRKVKLFRAQMEEAQRILTHHIISEQKPLPKTLSKLRKTYTNIINNDDNDDTKRKVVIKEESDDSNDEFNIEQNAPELCIEENKKEKVINTKCVTNNIESHYRIVYDSTEKGLRKEVALTTDDLKIWLERERHSGFLDNFKFKCKMCVEGFDVKEILVEHFLKYHDESIGPHICKICRFRFATETELCSHMQTHYCAWECTQCAFQCFSAKRFDAHIESHKTVQCVYCEVKFQDLATFYAHYKSLHSIFLCDHCGKRCKSKHLLEKHMRCHHISHTCSICSRTYKSPSALRKHTLLKHLATRSEDAYCVLCDKQYDSPLVYRRHVLTSKAHAHETQKHVGKEFRCPLCGNNYARRTNMMNHYRHVHMNQSKHYCSKCDKHFLNRTRLTDHMRSIHDGVKREKNKLCNICGRGFAANRTLVNHIRTHSGEKPFACEYCPARFTQRTSMTAHYKLVHMKILTKGAR